MPQTDEIKDLAKRLHGEIVADAPKIASKLFPATPPGMEKLTRNQYIDYVRTNWPDPQFRQTLLKRVGPRNFVDTAREMYGVNKTLAKELAVQEQA